MNSRASSSDPAAAFDRLHPVVQRWIRDQGWPALRQVQADATHAILGGSGDILITAPTAGGKTEAALLPVLTAVADHERESLAVLYVSPLKALINDQHRRLEGLCERLKLPLVRWHGEAPAAAKAQLLKKPRGMALITPESIESLLVRRPAIAARLWNDLQFLIIDELHAFLQGPRGVHLASLIKRIDTLTGRSARRIGLSATIGDTAQAQSYLRPDNAGAVHHVPSTAVGPELFLQVRGYVEPPQNIDPDAAEGQTQDRSALDRIADHLFEVLRGDNHLVFGGSRKIVESTADRLRLRAERARVPNEFFPHHGSIGKALREELEERLKDGRLPTTAVATTTLELGIDIGSVKSVAIIGAPRGIGSLRQKLGRTGRRQGVPASLRIYVRERAIEQRTSVLDQLRPNVVRAVAAVRLLAARFIEPAAPTRELLSTLVHQVLALIVQFGGSSAPRLYQQLCGQGPFAGITREDFVELLRGMGPKGAKLIEQAGDGTLMLGAEGEAIASSRDFYAVFESNDEWRLVTAGRTLGTLPLTNLVTEGSLVVFAGKRWRVDGIDQRTLTLDVSPHPGGTIPKFDRLDGEEAHARLIGEMRDVYMIDDTPPFLDAGARALLAEGRETFRRCRLDHTFLLADNDDATIFLWSGERQARVVAAALAMEGLNVEPHDLGVTIAKSGIEGATRTLTKLANAPAPDPAHVAAFVKNASAGKFLEHVPIGLQRTLWARQNADVVAAIPITAHRALLSS